MRYEMDFQPDLPFTSSGGGGAGLPGVIDQQVPKPWKPPKKLTNEHHRRFLRRILFNSFNHGGGCFAARATMAKWLKRTPRTVKLYRDHCVRHGLLVVMPRFGGRGEQKTSFMHLTPAGFAELEKHEPEKVRRAYLAKLAMFMDAWKERASYRGGLSRRPEVPVIVAGGPGITNGYENGLIPPVRVTEFEPSFDRESKFFPPEGGKRVYRSFTPTSPEFHPYFLRVSPNSGTGFDNSTECTGEQREKPEQEGKSYEEQPDNVGEAMAAQASNIPAAPFTKERMLWERTMEGLRRKVPSPFFQTFLAPIRAEPKGGGVLLLTIPGEKLLKHIEARYYPIILGTFREENPGVSMRFSLINREPNQARSPARKKSKSRKAV